MRSEDTKKFVQESFEEFDKLDDFGKWAVVQVFLDTPASSDPNSPFVEELRRRGYLRRKEEA